MTNCPAWEATGGREDEAMLEIHLSKWVMICEAGGFQMQDSGRKD